MNFFKEHKALTIVGIVGLLSVCLLCFGWFMIDTGLRSAGILPTYTPTATNTAIPTNTLVPTSTPEPTSTATSTPTNTPEPTSTATSTPTNTPETGLLNTPTIDGDMNHLAAAACYVLIQRGMPSYELNFYMNPVIVQDDTYRWTVISYFTAINDNNKMVRVDFICRVEYKGDDNWKLLEFIPIDPTTSS